MAVFYNISGTFYGDMSLFNEYYMNFDRACDALDEKIQKYIKDQQSEDDPPIEFEKPDREKFKTERDLLFDNEPYYMIKIQYNTYVFHIYELKLEDG